MIHVDEGFVIVGIVTHRSMEAKTRTRSFAHAFRHTTVLVVALSACSTDV